MKVPALSPLLAYGHARAGFGRTALSVIALALGVTLVVAIQLMNAAVLDSFIDTIDGMVGRAGLVVTAGEGLTFDEVLIERVAKIPGVTLAVPLVTGVAFPDDGSGELLTVHGVDIGNDAAVRVYHRGDTSNLIDDSIEFLSRKDSIILGREFAERRGLEVGSKLDLVTPTGVKTFTVRGLLDPEGLAKTLAGRLVVMDVYAAELAFTARGQINQIDLLVAKGQEEAVRRAVAAILPAGLKVEEPALRRDVVRKTVAGFQGMLAALAFLAVLAGFVICYSRLAAIFEARTWEIGLLRSVGLRRSTVLRELLKESLILGAIGTVVGVAVGLVVGRYALPVIATATALNFRLPVPAADAALTGRSVRLGMLVGLGAAVLAAALPALRLARKQPVAALTMRGRELPASEVGPRWLPAACLILASLALIVLQRATGLAMLGNITTVLVALVACVGAQPLVRRGSYPLIRLWARAFGPTGKFAAGHIGQRARGTALTIATLGIGLGAILMFGVLAWSFERTLVSQVSGRLKADLVVTSAFVSGGWVNAPLHERVRDRLADVPGVVAVAGEQRKDVRYRDGVAVLDSYDPVCFRDHRICEWPLEDNALPGALDAVARGDAGIVSTSFALQFGVRPGDTVELDSPHGLQRFLVAGVTRTEPTAAIIVSRDRYRLAWNDPMAPWVHVALSPGTRREVVEGIIAQSLGRDHRLRVRSGAELIAYFASQARQGFHMLYVMEAIIFLLVVVGLGDTLATSVLERTREFGMMRAIGLRRSQLFMMVLLEGAAIGLLGLLLAVVTGMALGTFWVEMQFPALLGWALDLHVPYSFIVTAAALTLVLCVAASLLPSVRAARLPVTSALRAE